MDFAIACCGAKRWLEQWLRCRRRRSSRSWRRSALIGSLSTPSTAFLPPPICKRCCKRLARLFLVRLSAAAEVPIKQALDVGAAGIIVPQVNSAAQAEQIVRWAKYAPVGARGVGVARAHGYGLRLQEYLATANERTAVVVQAEHIDAVQQIEAIVQVAGIDAVLVGPYDLSASLGRMGQLDHPDVVQAIDHVTDVCRAAGMALGIFGISAEAVRPYLARGYTLIVAGVDTLLLGQAARELLAQLRR
jgi:2-dehydro-3-deoxyglucarate aldolase